MAVHSGTIYPFPPHQHIHTQQIDPPPSLTSTLPGTGSGVCAFLSLDSHTWDLVWPAISTAALSRSFDCGMTASVHSGCIFLSNPFHWGYRRVWKVWVPQPLHCFELLTMTGLNSLFWAFRNLKLLRHSQFSWVEQLRRDISKESLLLKCSHFTFSVLLCSLVQQKRTTSWHNY